MTRTWFPEAHYMPDMGQYRPTYRWHLEDGWTLVPGRKLYPSVGQAIDAAKQYLIAAQKPIRAARVESANDDPLGVAAWRDERAGKAAEDQQQALGAVIVRGRQVQVERRRIA